MVAPTPELDGARNCRDSDAVAPIMGGLPTITYWTKTYPTALGSIFFVFAIFASWLVWLYPNTSIIGIALVVVTIAVATLYQIEWGIALVFAELMIGSFGRWLPLPQPFDRFSVRMLIFGVFFACWAVRWLRDKTRGHGYQWTRSVAQPWIVLAVLASLYGILRAMIRATPIADVIDDSNQWLFLAIVIPLGFCHGGRLASILGRLFPAASIAVFIVGATFLYVFTHEGALHIAMAVYRWTRDTLVAEVTVITPTVVRVFLQSQVIAIPVLWALLLQRKITVRSSLFLAIVMSSIIMSLSRSIAVGVLGAVAIAVAATSHRWIIVRNLIFGSISGLILLFAIVRFPLPIAGTGDVMQSIIERSTVDDSATRTRWALLDPLWQEVLKHPVLGSGLGASVVFQSQDPRVLEDHPGGWFRTHAFEWGVLDFWYKFGLFGLALYLSILWQSYRYSRQGKPKAALSVLTLGFIHIFTPYLNHPIGLMLLLSITILAREGDIFDKPSEGFIL